MAGLKTGWSELLGVQRVEAVERVPKGWQTTEQIARELGLSTRATFTQITRLLKLGRVEMKRFRIPCAGSTRPVPHYRRK